MDKPKSLLAIVGPTATGKTALTVQIASDLGGEIVSADSRQVYRYMDIGTAKPTAEQRAAVPHHLIDTIDPDEEYSLALFLRQAREAIDDIQSRSKLPVLVGGTGQYVRGLLEGWQVPEVPPDRKRRSILEQRAREEGTNALYEELVRLDPAAARRIDPRNARRVIRALEVRQALGGDYASKPKRLAPPFDPTVIGLTIDRLALYRRIDDRVDRMMEAGWLGEVETLLDRGYHGGLPSMSSLGYGELARHLTAGTPIDDAVLEIKQNTHRFARHQYGWFRTEDERITWFQATPEGLDGASKQAVDLLARN